MRVNLMMIWSAIFVLLGMHSIWTCNFAQGEMSLEIYVFRLVILFRHLRACDVPVIEKPLLSYHSLDPLAIDI